MIPFVMVVKIDPYSSYFAINTKCIY